MCIFAIPAERRGWRQRFARRPVGGLLLMKKRSLTRSFLRLRKIFQCIIDALVDKLASAHVEFCSRCVDLRQFVRRNADRDRFLGILLRDEIRHGNHLLQYSMLWCILNIDSKSAYVLAYRRRETWNIRRCTHCCSTPLQMH